VTDGEECNDPVASADVMVMRTAKSKIAAGFAVAALVASAGVGASQATSGADPAAGHQVRYTLTTANASDFQVLYLINQPPNKQAYNTDAYSFVKRETVNVGPDAPWVFETTLADPQWAIFQVSSVTHGGRPDPDAHCEITVDGQMAVQQNDPHSPVCQLGQW
jgi:hypothetical protein